MTGYTCRFYARLWARDGPTFEAIHAMRLKCHADMIARRNAGERAAARVWFLSGDVGV